MFAACCAEEPRVVEDDLEVLAASSVHHEEWGFWCMSMFSDNLSLQTRGDDLKTSPDP